MTTAKFSRVGPVTGDVRKVVMNKLRSPADAFLKSLSPATRRVYRQDLNRFSEFINISSPAAALDHLMSMSPTFADEVFQAYKAALIESGAPASTLTRRLASLRSAAAFYRRAGLSEWQPPALAQPPMSNARDLDLKNAIAARDEAMIKLSQEAQISCSSLASLCVSDLQPNYESIWAARKHRDRVSIRLSSETAVSLSDWCLIRQRLVSESERALFVNLSRDKRKSCERFSVQGVFNIVSGRGANGLKKKLP